MEQVYNRSEDVEAQLQGGTALQDHLLPTGEGPTASAIEYIDSGCPVTSEIVSVQSGVISESVTGLDLPSETERFATGSNPRPSSEIAGHQDVAPTSNATARQEHLLTQNEITRIGATSEIDGYHNVAPPSLAPPVAGSLVETQYNVPQSGDVDIHGQDTQESMDIDIRYEKFKRRCGICLQCHSKFITSHCGCLLSCGACINDMLGYPCPRCDSLIMEFQYYQFHSVG